MRRGFFEALEQAPQRAGWVLLQIGHLYTGERRLRRPRAGPRLRAATPMSQSRMIYERLHRVLTAWQTHGRILPHSSLGKAIRSALGQWASLAVYLHDGTLEIDNNLVENAIRPTAVGKNYAKVGIRQRSSQEWHDFDGWRLIRAAGAGLPALPN